MQPIIEMSTHPLRSDLSQLPATSIHVQAHKLASLIAEIPKSPNLESSPRGIVVGSFPLEPDKSNDLDLEVQGVSWEDLQEFFSDKEGKAAISSVTLTNGGKDGIIDPSQPGQIGNAFVAVWLTLDGGRKANLSIPLRVTENTTRYDLNSVERDPDLPFTEAAKRRNFAHRAVGYDPLGDRRGTLEDPFNGSNRLQNKELEILDGASYRRDPLGLYQAIREMASREMKPESTTRALLMEMACTSLPTGKGEIREDRVKHERFLFLVGDAAPSLCINAAIQIGLASRDFEELDALHQQLSDAEMGSRWDKAWQRIDQSWRTSQQQEGWSAQEKLNLVAAHFGHEVQELSNALGSSYNWSETITAFIPGSTEFVGETLADIERRIQSLRGKSA